MFSSPGLLVSRLLFIGLVVEAFEILTLRRAFADGGMFSRSTVAILTGGMPWYVRIGATAGGSRAMTVAMVCQAFAAIVVVIEGTGTNAGIVSAMICLVTNGYLRSRRPIGSSGAEQLTFIVLVTFS